MPMRRTARVMPFRLPLWLLALGLVPAAAVFFASLLIAVAVVALGVAAFALVGPGFRRAPRPQAPLDERHPEAVRAGDIELDPSEFRRIAQGRRSRDERRS